MRVVIFDVSNGFCALAVCNNGNSMMIDCGSHSEKVNPVDQSKSLMASGNWLDHAKQYNAFGTNYDLTKLLITHPDEDHIRNIERVHKELRPGILRRRHLEDFPSQSLTPNPALEYYEKHLCSRYRTTIENQPNWAFSIKNFEVPINVLTSDERFQFGKFSNNSSIVTLLEYGGRKILFCGDIETAGWSWLLENNHAFVEAVSGGVEVHVASHHGHKSGFPESLFSEFGAPLLSILSKGREFKDKTDVDSRYSRDSIGYNVKSLEKDSFDKKYSLTSRANGNVYIEFSREGQIYAFSSR
ncbi:MAG: MBL fold metallo-hydrolase [Pseudomonadota bacterium]